ncbi:glycoside hydrolase family 78 protein [Lentilactobacillus hilgardii]|uniref:glycoside hydrolase family 78 protein n=1 Tax=Lentilactobacillus hilgardii TaxID=1588 RepID=UPI0021A67A62|nr:glycoside hydrolase family 78 protein [Lentilactobacillus hilgardii]MCT3400380.1 alpha-L-rhamnosidase [Lentilactobacillus hilgardii]
MVDTDQKLLMPTHLNVNLLSFAYNVEQSPVFSWWDHSRLSNSYQTAFQIVVSKRLHELANQTYLFNSGWVAVTNNTAVKLAQLSSLLQAGELYYWQVRIKDNHGNISDFSEPNKFICDDKLNEIPKGIWSSKTSTVDQELPKLGNVAFIRSPQITLNSAEIDTAVITAFSRGNESLFAQGFDLFMNGRSIGVGSARPQADYDGSDQTGIYYNKYDVTEFIKNGKNVISSLAIASSKRKAFWCQLDVYRTDGTKKRVIVTDSSWKALDGSSAFGDFGVKMRSLYFGQVSENVDMRYYPQNWTTVNFQDDGWDNAWVNPNVMVNTSERLVPYRSENTLRIDSHQPTKKISKLGPQNYLIDLGKEIIGGVNVHLDSQLLQRVTILMGEQLKDDGHVRHHLACGPDYVENWTLVQGENSFTTLQMKNYRYIELVGFKGDLKLNDINGWAMEQAFPETESSFESDNDLLNREYELSKYSIKATNQDVFVDSQARERRPYEGDLLVNGNTSYVVSSHYSLGRHSLDYLIDNPTWPEDYKLFNVEMAWLDYLYTGNDELLHDRYDDLKVKFNRGKGADSFDGAAHDFMGTLRNGKGIDNFDEQVGLVTNDGLIDWPIRERDGFVEGEYNTPFNAIYFGTYRMMSKIAKVTNHPNDVRFYEQRANRIKRQLIDKLYDPQTGRFYDSLNKDLSVNKHTSHHASAYALCYGVYDGQNMADKISQFVANDGEFIGSVYFIYFMSKGLIDSGHATDAIALLTNDDNRKDKKTFAAILDQLNATIAPEAWSNAYKPNLTLSHPWGATPGLTIVQGIMGINPIKPGFETFRIKIRSGNLSYLRVTTPSSRGIIKAKYNRENRHVQINVDIPMNTEAVIDLEKGSQSVVIQDIDGNQLSGDLSTENSFTLSSGKYQIAYELLNTKQLHV